MPAMSATRSKMRKRKSTNLRIGIIVGLLGIFSILLISICVLVFMFSNPQPPIQTPVAQLSIEQIIVQTASAAQQQTQALYTPILPPTMNGTSTFTPTVTIMPTNFIFNLQTNVAQTPFLYYTSTPFIYVPPVYVTPISPVYVPPPSGGSGGGCCKVCTTGKACGDSCISLDKTCHSPPGCAC